MTTNPEIHLAFRFHGNFYHSYRGDTPDELGFGKDIRIVRHIIDELDRFNSLDIPVRGTWDFENYFSLEKIMPEHCPELIEALQRRVREGLDEIELMSWNNGIMTAHTEAEFDAAIGRAISNPAGSGVADLFDRWEPIVRPQEMMFTPAHLKAYRKHGITAVSLYYSSLPFNGFSTFIPPLGVSRQYNPLTLSYPGMEETMTLIPAYSTGDIVDNLSLRSWVKRIRRLQLRESEPRDLLLLIDMDADDEFWYAMAGPLVTRLYPSAGGIRGLVDSVRDLPWLRFTTPGRYLRDHAPVDTVTFGQDTADGSFDGIASWAEKYSSHELWTLMDRSRLYSMQAKSFLDYPQADYPQADATDASGTVDVSRDRDSRHLVEKKLEEAFELRLRALSTTHFGMSSPVMNVTRLNAGRDILERSVAAALAACDLARELAVADTGSRRAKTDTSDSDSPTSFLLRDFSRRDVGGLEIPKSPQIVRIPLPGALHKLPSAGPVELSSVDESTVRVPGLILPNHRGSGSKLVFSIPTPGNENLEASVVSEDFKPALVTHPEDGQTIECGPWSLTPDRGKGLHPVAFKGRALSREALLTTSVRYRGKLRTVRNWRVDSVIGDPETGITVLIIAGSLDLLGEKTPEHPGPGVQAPSPEGDDRILRVYREVVLSPEVPSLYVFTRMIYPQTPHQGYKRKKAQRLEQTWDERWEEVMPCEIRPTLGSASSLSRDLDTGQGTGQESGTNKIPPIWKHNYFGHMSTYTPDYSGYSKNRELDSVNNHVTGSWVAVSDGHFGLLVAQTSEVAASMAFCPMRTRRQDTGLSIRLNPFGAYFGKQYRYPTAFSGLGYFSAVKLSASDHITSYAPSFNGVTQDFEIMIAPYEGDAPPEQLRADAEAYAFPMYLKGRV